MYIDNLPPNINFIPARTEGVTPLQTPAGDVSNYERQPTAGVVPSESPNAYYYGSGVVVDISPEGRAAAAKLNNAQADSGGTKGIGSIEGPKECQTCKNRKYVDGSNDPSVSYQSPTHISPGQAASSVMAHEREHVTNEQARAEREDRKVVSQTVSLSTSVCPECGRIYISGGVTRTVTKGGNSDKQPENINSSGENNA